MAFISIGFYTFHESVSMGVRGRFAEGGLYDQVSLKMMYGNAVGKISIRMNRVIVAKGSSRGYLAESYPLWRYREISFRTDNLSSLGSNNFPSTPPQPACRLF